MRIALVEDNPAIGEMVMMALECAGYPAVRWADGASFLGWVSSQHDALLPVDFLITDWRLPGGISGGDVIDGLRRQSPESVLVLIVTGTSDTEIASIRGRYPGVPIMRKPFHIRDLLHLLQQMVPHS